MTERLLELAKAQALQDHVDGISCRPNRGGHDPGTDGVDDENLGFATCPHPDCVLVRGGSAPATMTLDEQNAEIEATTKVWNHGFAMGTRHADEASAARIAKLRKLQNWCEQRAEEMNDKGLDKAGTKAAWECAGASEAFGLCATKLDALLTPAAQSTET